MGASIGQRFTPGRTLTRHHAHAAIGASLKLIWHCQAKWVAEAFRRHSAATGRAFPRSRTIADIRLTANLGQ